MTNVVNPIDAPDAYDCLVLAGKASPGVCTIKVEGRETGWDEQEAKGQDFATTVKNGTKLVKFSATFVLTRDEARDDYTAMDDWEKVLDTPVKPKDPKAIDCYHPQLAELKVRSCVVKKRGSREPGSGEKTGSCTVTHDFLEFNPPKPSPSTAMNGSKDKNGDPNKDVKDQLQDQTDQFKDLQNQWNHQRT